MGVGNRILGKVRKGIRKGTKVVLKKAWKGGKTVAKRAAMKGLKMGVKHANRAIDTSIRGVGMAASGTVGNPAPAIGAELLIRGKNHLMAKGASRFAKASGKALQSYTASKKVNSAPRKKKNLGIGMQSHSYAALSKLHRQVNPREFKTPSSDYLNRKTDDFAGGRKRQYFPTRARRNTGHYNAAARPTGSALSTA